MASALLFLALPFSGSGCALIYRHQYRADRFVIYSDLDPAFLRQIGPQVERIYEGFGELFEVPPERLGRTAIILKGSERDMEVVDLAYSPSLLGYYIPFLNLISVDTKPAWTREEAMLRQILLHEVGHHFIVTQYPPASKECWLNEGLAGNLEMSLFEKGRFEYPLLNPVLLGIARHSVLVNPAAADLEKLLSLNWNEFHGEADKELDYALSWSIVYYILDRRFSPEVPMGERIQRLYLMDRQTVVGMQREWSEFLRNFDLTGKLIELARAAPESALGVLTPRWAVRQMGTLKFLDEPRAAAALVEALDSSDPALRRQAGLAFLKRLARQGSGGISTLSTGAPEVEAGNDVLERGRKKIAAMIGEARQPLELREALTSSLGDLARSDPRWVPVLINLLEAPEGPIRAAAAQGLSGLGLKRTIVNPAFWRDGKLSARVAEVTEWQDWWDTQGSLLRLGPAGEPRRAEL